MFGDIWENGHISPMSAYKPPLQRNRLEGITTNIKILMMIYERWILRVRRIPKFIDFICLYLPRIASRVMSIPPFDWFHNSPFKGFRRYWEISTNRLKCFELAKIANLDRPWVIPLSQHFYSRLFWSRSSICQFIESRWFGHVHISPRTALNGWINPLLFWKSMLTKLRLLNVRRITPHIPQANHKHTTIVFWIW